VPPRGPPAGGAARAPRAPAAAARPERVAVGAAVPRAVPARDRPALRSRARGQDGRGCASESIMRTTRLGAAALAGASGALTLTLLHETASRLSPLAPRMDIVAMRGLAKIFGD